jgi:hypothetical protein
VHARQFVANLPFLCLVFAHLASKVLDRAFSTLFNRNAATALSSIAIVHINAWMIILARDSTLK